MTVNINSLTSLFADANSSYTAVSLNVTDLGSGANSLLFHIGVNNNTKFSIDKTGAVRINSTPRNNTISVFTLTTNYIDTLDITDQRAYFRTPLWVNSIGEKWIDITSQGQDIRIAAYNASLYYTETSHINSFEIYEPLVVDSGGRSHSTTITLVLNGPTTFANSAWANVSWSSAAPPSNTTGPTVLTFMQYYTSIDPKWFGIIAGKNFA